MKLTLRAIAVLMGYPSAEIQAHAAEIRSTLEEEGVLPVALRRRVDLLLRRLEREDLLDLQSAYSELFDRSRSLSLHLFEHVHGESRERGQAMIDLGQQYAERGFLLDSRELPDFIPVFLEYASCLPPTEARETLGQPAHVFAALAERLDGRDEAGAAYGALFHAILAAAGAAPDADALAELAERTPDDDPARIDEEWEEAPVTFSSTAAHEMGGPTGVVAKIRAAKRAVTEAIKG